MTRITAKSSARNAFTLVELLVVLAIMAVLAALLLPAVNRIREHAKMAKCLVNLRQLSIAVNTYCQDNEDWYPTPAEWLNDTSGWLYTDWVYWQPLHNDVHQSRIAPYLGKGIAQILVCPSDDINLHLVTNPTYPYSYSINEYMARAHLLGHPLPIRRAKVVSPSEKILIVDEDSGTIDDGSWAPARYFAHGRNLLSNRHDKTREDSKNPDDGRGNVAFADCHCAIISRRDSTNPDFYIAFPGEAGELGPLGN